MTVWPQDNTSKVLGAGPICDELIIKSYRLGGQSPVKYAGNIPTFEAGSRSRAPREGCRKC